MNKRIFAASFLMLCISAAVILLNNCLKTPIESKEIICTRNFETKKISLINLKYKSDDIQTVSLDFDEVAVGGEENFRIFDVPKGKDFKSYMDAGYITDETSSQYRLKCYYELDPKTGIYKVDGRYCAALGSYYSTRIGTCFDVYMSSGSVIPCILADCKADAHTDMLNRYTVFNDSVLEFVIDTDTLVPLLIAGRGSNTGDISDLDSMFRGEIDHIRIYD